MCNTYLFTYTFFLKNILLTAPDLSCSLGDLVPWPGIEQPRIPALGAWSCTHWTTREVLVYKFFITTLILIYIQILQKTVLSKCKADPVQLYLHGHRLMDIYFIGWIKLKNYHCLFLTQLISAQDIFLQVGCMVFPQPSSFSWAHSHALKPQGGQDSRVFPYPSPAIDCFCKMPQFILLEEGTQKPKSGCWVYLRLLKYRGRKYMDL